MNKNGYDRVKKTSYGVTIVGIKTGGYSLTQDEIKWGCVNEAGDEIAPCKYDYFGNFVDGVAVIGIGGWGFWGDCSVEFLGKWGCLDTSGNEIIPIGKYGKIGYDGCKRFPYVAVFADGMIAVCDWQTSKWGFVDNTGKEVIPCKYDNVEWFPRGSKQDLFDPSRPFYSGMAKVCLDGNWLYVDREGVEKNIE